MKKTISLVISVIAIALVLAMAIGVSKGFDGILGGISGNLGGGSQTDDNGIDTVPGDSDAKQFELQEVKSIDSFYREENYCIRCNQVESDLYDVYLVYPDYCLNKNVSYNIGISGSSVRDFVWAKELTDGFKFARANYNSFSLDNLEFIELNFKTPNNSSEFVSFDFCTSSVNYDEALIFYLGQYHYGAIDSSPPDCVNVVFYDADVTFTIYEYVEK